LKKTSANRGPDLEKRAGIGERSGDGRELFAEIPPKLWGRVNKK